MASSSDLMLGDTYGHRHQYYSAFCVSNVQDLISLCKGIDLLLLEEKLEENRKKRYQRSVKRKNTLKQPLLTEVYLDY